MNERDSDQSDCISSQHLLLHPSVRAGEEEGGEAEGAGGQREGGSQTGEGGAEGEKEERVQRSGGGRGCTGTAEEEERGEEEKERTGSRWDDAPLKGMVHVFFFFLQIYQHTLVY